jgi:DegV family protein with EDD domain
VVAWAEANRLRANAYFTVDSFEYLVRGGRVSPAVGAVGSALNVKPVLYVDAEGRLTALKRVRGRRHALAALADLIVDRIVDPGQQTIIVTHAQCLDDAKSLIGLLTDRLAVQDVRLGRIGVIIGTHTGPGGLAVGFWGKPLSA